jgi:hypothetical protein
MTYNENIKQSIYKWRENHKEEHLKYSRDYERKRYEIVREQKIQKVLGRYYFKKECKIFLRILIDEI